VIKRKTNWLTNQTNSSDPTKVADLTAQEENVGRWDVHTRERMFDEQPVNE